jgi:antirestriction protein ArdC
MTNTKKRSWRRRLAVALGGLVLMGSVGVGVVYWQYFRKDPAFLEEKRQSDQTQQELDEMFADEPPSEPAGTEG